MTIVNAKFPANLFAPTAAPPTRDLVGNSSHLQLEQQVQAQVVAVDNDRTVLEVGSRRYQVSGRSDLLPGEKLMLQVVQLEPQLEFQVISSRTDSWLAQRIPLLAKPFDWGDLAVQLQALATDGKLPRSTLTVLNQLVDILTFSAVPADLKEQVSQIIARLQQLTAPEGKELFISPGGADSAITAVPLNYQQPGPLESSQSFAALVKNLQNQLSQLSRTSTMAANRSFATALGGLLDSLSAHRDTSQMKGALPPLLGQLQQLSDFPPRLMADIQRLVAKINSENIQPVAIVEGPEREPFAVVAGTSSGLAAPAKSEIAEIATEIRTLLDQIAQLQDRSRGAPDLLGRLDGLRLRLQTLAEPALATPEIKVLLDQLIQLGSQRSSTLSGHQLGVLSQLFGLQLETDLLDGKNKAALASLKLCLLELQKTHDSDDIDGPLRRLELLQLCKAKLAGEQVQFLPLPFSELEEGYLLAEKRSKPEGEQSGKAPLQMSLSLRLSALGNVRIDMLYDEAGLHLRLAGEDRCKMEFIQGCSEELRKSLNAVKLQGISFSADARLPAQQLQERLLPKSLNMLDTRI